MFNVVKVVSCHVSDVDCRGAFRHGILRDSPPGGGIPGSHVTHLVARGSIFYKKLHFDTDTFQTWSVYPVLFLHRDDAIANPPKLSQ